jgi:NADPH-dependent 2,4-dienoyl-CoA reductase/sulfur reductase-like enzyme
MTVYDVAVVGAGPAGLAATASAVGAGRRVAVVDAGNQPGGQYWRHRQYFPPVSTHYKKLANSLKAAHYLPGATVWFAEPGFVLHTGAGVVEARRLVLATGAHDRVVPFSGWDLPGVVTAGGAQSLLKGNGVLVGRRIVVAGTGPFLLPVAAGLADGGAEVVGVFEANNPLRMLRRLPLPATKVIEAARYAGSFVRHRIPYRTGHTVIAAHGTTEVEAVTVARPDGTTGKLDCDTLAIGYGFVPSLELALALGCATRLETDGTLVLEADFTQRTTVPDVYAAGEIIGVGGADLAIVEGTIAGAAASGSTPPPGILRRRARARRFAATLRTSYPVPANWSDHLTDDTLVCRCEEVPHRTVRAAVHNLGATDARTVKMVTRTGMGWCQGRICGYAVACEAARLLGRPRTAADLEAFAHRPFAAPVTLGELAAEPGLIE